MELYTRYQVYNLSHERFLHPLPGFLQLCVGYSQVEWLMLTLILCSFMPKSLTNVVPRAVFL
jgi:hypothetical protein